MGQAAAVRAAARRPGAKLCSQRAKPVSADRVARDFVAGTRALVLGGGDVGSAVATVLGELGCDVTGVSRTGRSSAAAFGAVHTVEALPSLVREAHWIVITLPLTPATRGLFSRDVMSRCRGAVLLNAARGGIVEERALPEALDRGWLQSV